MTPRVWVIAPGGRHDTGGICRMVDYQAAAFDLTDPGAMRVLDSGGMAPWPIMPVRTLAALARVAAFGLAGRIDLLHVHVAAWGSVARKAPFILLGRALRIPVVLHLHAADFVEFHATLPRPGRALVRAVFAAADAVVVLGAKARAFLHAELGIAAERLHIVQNAVPDDAPGGMRDRSEEPRAFCRLAFLGALTERKGLGELIDALASPALSTLPWRLSVIGNGSDAPWRARAERAGVAARIDFHGWLPSGQARAFLAARADLLVLPSRAEGLPMVILEAMAAGLPVVATDVGDVGEAVRDGVTGALVPARDPQALAHALHRFVASEALRSRAGRAGRSLYEARFTVDTYRRRLTSLFGLLTRTAGRVGIVAAKADAR